MVILLFKLITIFFYVMYFTLKCEIFNIILGIYIYTQISMDLQNLDLIYIPLQI